MLKELHPYAEAPYRDLLDNIDPLMAGLSAHGISAGKRPSTVKQYVNLVKAMLRRFDIRSNSKWNVEILSYSESSRGTRTVARNLFLEYMGIKDEGHKVKRPGLAADKVNERVARARARIREQLHEWEVLQRTFPDKDLPAAEDLVAEFMLQIRRIMDKREIVMTALERTGVSEAIDALEKSRTETRQHKKKEVEHEDIVADSNNEAEQDSLDEPDISIDDLINRIKNQL